MIYNICTYDKFMNKVGVIGSGKFGTTIAHLLSENVEVILFTRRQNVADDINNNHNHLGVAFPPTIRATTDIETIARSCKVIFPVIPSSHFRSTMKAFYPYLTPEHILIHGTKGLDCTLNKEDNDHKLSRNDVSTMSEVIKQETNVLRVGCLSGPNLANEILQGQPTATVIASDYDEVIDYGESYLSSNRFFVFASHDILGAELAGALKNIIALGSGILGGLDLGKNIQAMLITRGLREMIAFGKAMGATSRSFVGTAGIGDLIATATSKHSRNYQFGKAIGQGKSMEEALDQMTEVAEGVNTVKIAKALADYYDIKVPITQMIYSAIYEKYPIDRAIHYLMRYPFSPDVDFL